MALAMQTELWVQMEQVLIMATMASNSIKVDIMGKKFSTLKYKIQPCSSGSVQAQTLRIYSC